MLDLYPAGRSGVTPSDGEKDPIHEQIFYFLFSHLLHNSGFLAEVRTPKIFDAISRYKNPSSGTLHFLHFLVIAFSPQ
jgi:hypothetical protein